MQFVQYLELHLSTDFHEFGNTLQKNQHTQADYLSIE